MHSKFEWLLVLSFQKIWFMNLIYIQSGFIHFKLDLGFLFSDSNFFFFLDSFHFRAVFRNLFCLATPLTLKTNFCDTFYYWVDESGAFNEYFRNLATPKRFTCRHLATPTLRNTALDIWTLEESSKLDTTKINMEIFIEGFEWKIK